MSTKHIKWTTFEDMPIAEFRVRAARVQDKAVAFVAAVDEEFPGLITLTTTEREHAPRLHDGEHPMLERTLQAAEARPELFASLADEDDGMDPTKFETQLLRDRIEKHELLLGVTTTLTPIATKVSDSTHYLATKFRGAVGSAYRIAKTHAKTDRVIANIMAPVFDYMRRGVDAALATRAANKAAREKK